MRNAAADLRRRDALRTRGPRAGWVRDIRGSLLIAGMIWFSIVYLTVPWSSFNAQVGTAADLTAPSPIFRAIKLTLIAMSILIILWRRTLAWWLLHSVNRFFVFCLVLIPLSYFWSIDSSATFARFVSLASMVLVSFAFVLAGWHPHRFQNVVRPIVTLMLAASIVFGIFFPDLAIEVGEGTLKNAWRGLTSQKNQFGVLASLGVVFWLHAWLAKEAKTWIAMLGILISGTCLLLSRSSTSLLATVLTAAFMFMLFFSPGNLRRYMPFVVGTFAAIVMIYALAVLNLVPGLDKLLTPITRLTGKDMTFSNRSVIWMIIEEHIRLRPYLGSGYGAYWVGAIPSSPSYEFLARMYFYPTESHNGYLEVVNDLGFVGLVGLLGYLITFVGQSLRLMKVERNQAILYLGIFFQQAVGNLSESYWLQLGFGVTIFSLATFSIARAFLDYQLKEYFGAPNRGVAISGRTRS